MVCGTRGKKTTNMRLIEEFFVVLVKRARGAYSGTCWRLISILLLIKEAFYWVITWTEFIIALLLYPLNLTGFIVYIFRFKLFQTFIITFYIWKTYNLILRVFIWAGWAKCPSDTRQAHILFTITASVFLILCLGRGDWLTTLELCWILYKGR